jgi:NADH-quinone oxidoreductase subunit E
MVGPLSQLPRQQVGSSVYSQIFRQPVGRHVIRYCDSVVCHITGFQGIQSAR